MDELSDSEDLSGFEWGSDDDGDIDRRAPTSAPVVAEPAAVVAREVCEAGSSRPKMVSYFMGMGFSEQLVVKAIEENGEADEGAILNSLLTYSAIEESPPSRKPSPCGSSDSTSDEDLEDDTFFNEDSSGEEYTLDDVAPHEQLSTLVKMGFTEEEAASAIERCGPNSSMPELADSIHAARLAKAFDAEETAGDDVLYYSHKDKKMWREMYDSASGKKRRILEDCSWKRKERLSEKVHVNKRSKNHWKVKDMEECNETTCQLPNPMVGFGLPGDSWTITSRKLPDAAIGPPYFYYENVALTPKGVWADISRFLYDIEPEFVDSKYFCAAARKRGYIHNLPIQNRFPILPLQPKTIHEALPITKKWWPKWDQRTQLNCLQTCTASAKLTDRLRNMLVPHGEIPPIFIQQAVLKECRKWNLVWVGLNKLAYLEPDEIETLLGFPKNHTRGGGISRTERYKSLGNSFQIDTVAYHLSVLKDMFPSGMTVLSLFSGIGGAEVALHRIGIHLKTVVSVEISEINRNILRSWWEQTGQTGNLIDITDVQQVTYEKLENMMNTFGGFDLVIGGSPCNNLAGSNRVARDGLQGEHSSLFYDYVRILDHVKNIMGRNM